jgi:adenine phosphoribosyltransferase
MMEDGLMEDGLMEDGLMEDGMTDDRDRRWYLKLMAPNTKGERFAWLDPSAMYVNARAFNALLDDLTAPFSPDEVDLVAGPDAMGFVLGTGIATRLGKGFLTIRKAGRVPVPSDLVDFQNYTGRVQQLETRRPAFAPGTRVLLVDQWIETGGTMRGSIELVERQGGVVAGIATVCIEETHGAGKLRDDYKCATAVMPGSELQRQCNAKWLDTFEAFDWDSIFPEIGGAA